MNRGPVGKQRGAVLVVSLILLAVITLLTVTAQNLSPGTGASRVRPARAADIRMAARS